MGDIKSALELAMERTAGLKIDVAEMRRQQAKKDGKALVSRWLASAGDDAELSLQLQQLPKQEEAASRFEGLREVLLAQVRLPQDQGAGVLGRLASLVALLPLSPQLQAQLAQVVQQLEALQRQFLEHRKQVREQLTRQLEPYMRQKERQLERQTGKNIRLPIEADPQFRELLQQQMLRLEEEFQPYLQQFRQAMGQALSF